ncbi:MAG: sodium:solute symporter [Prolixibacteraceae bacterium]
MTLTVLILYLLFLSFIAFRSFQKINNYADFFVARKKGSFRTVTGSLLATILGGSAVIGAIDAGKNMGWATSWFMLCAAIGLFALLPFTKRISQLGRYTLPDLLEDLYGRKTKTIASFMIPLAWLGIVAAQLIASARILQSFTGLNYVWGVLISAFVFTAYTIAGGQLSVLKTDFTQAILIITGLLVIAFFSFSQLPMEKFRQFPLNLPFNAHFRPTDLFILLLTYSSTFTAGPDIYSRIFCAANEKTAKRAVLSTALTLIPIALIIGYLSVVGALLPGTNEHGASLVEIAQTILPLWVIPLIVIALLSAVLSSADTTILSASIIVCDLISKSKFDHNTLKTTRIIILLFGILSAIIAINFTSIIEMLLIALTVYSGAFILPVLFGLAKVKIRSEFVSAAIIIGGLVALTGKLMSFTNWGYWSNWIIVSAFAFNAILLLAGKIKTKEKIFSN